MKEDFLSVSNSILLAGILIAVSIFLNGRVSSSGQGQTAAAAGSDPSAQVFKITDRSTAAREGNGKVTVVEFSDFQCPFCKSFYQNTYPQLKKDYIDTGKITFIYRYYPLTTIHVNAQISAEAGECTNVQGKFWPYFDTLFTKGQSDGTGLDIASLKKYAADDGLDVQKFNSCLDSHQTADVVTVDLSEGQKDSVTGTPTFFVNGKKIIGAEPYSVFQQAIDAELK